MRIVLVFLWIWTAGQVWLCQAYLYPSQLADFVADKGLDAYRLETGGLSDCSGLTPNPGRSAAISDIDELFGAGLSRSATWVYFLSDCDEETMVVIMPNGRIYIGPFDDMIAGPTSFIQPDPPWLKGWWQL